MAVEVEIKARIDKFPQIDKRVADICEYLGETVKEDTYYSLPTVLNGSQTLRIRTEGNSATVTFKNKSLREKGEVNEETEFLISDPAAFLKFLDLLGSREFLKKRKTGTRYASGRLTVELLTIDTLGRFIEVEKLINSSEQNEISKALEEIKAFLSELGISEDMFCESFYTDMLLDRKGKDKQNNQF